MMVVVKNGWLICAEEMEKVKEIEKSAEGKLEAIMAKLTDIDGLEKAFQGCRGVFHTSAFTDPAGLSGYTVRTLFSPVIRVLNLLL